MASRIVYACSPRQWQTYLGKNNNCKAGLGTVDLLLPSFDPRGIVREYSNRHFCIPRASGEGSPALRDKGFTEDEISVIAKGGDKQGDVEAGGAMDAMGVAGQGTAWGSVLGGAAGLLAGVGALAIPGIGPIVAAGPLAATLPEQSPGVWQEGSWIWESQRSGAGITKRKSKRAASWQ